MPLNVKQCHPVHHHKCQCYCSLKAFEAISIPNNVNISLPTHDWSMWDQGHELILFNTVLDNLFAFNKVKATPEWCLHIRYVMSILAHEGSEKHKCLKLKSMEEECNNAKKSGKTFLDNTNTTVDHCISVRCWFYKLDELLQCITSLAQHCDLRNYGAIEWKVQCWIIRMIPKPSMACTLLKVSLYKMIDDFIEAYCTHYSLDANLKAINLCNPKADNIHCSANWCWKGVTQPGQAQKLALGA